VPGSPDFAIARFAPSAQRPYYTYTTLGLSLRRQEGEPARIELIAYSTKPDERIEQSLIELGRFCTQPSGDADPGPFAVEDTVEIDTKKPIDTRFALLAPPEAPALARFEDAWFTQAVEGAMPRLYLAWLAPVPIAVDVDPGLPPPRLTTVQLVQVLPLTADELAFSDHHGVPALLEKMSLGKRERGFGWGRAAKDSTVPHAAPPPPAPPPRKNYNDFVKRLLHKVNTKNH
jgi:hypothetical protein